MKFFNAIFSSLLIANFTLFGCSVDADIEPSIAPETVFEDFQIPAVPAISSLTAVSSLPNGPINAEGTDFRIERLRVKHHQVECEGYFVTHCLLTQNENSDEWLYFYDTIEGFNYEWGMNYEILMEVRTTNTGVAKAPRLTYTLVEILSQAQHEPDEVFQYASRKSDERITQTSPSEFSLLGNKPFVCDSDNCETLRSTMVQGQSALLSFRHSSSRDGPLVLQAVLCVDSPQSFNESCL